LDRTSDLRRQHHRQRLDQLGKDKDYDYNYYPQNVFDSKSVAANNPPPEPTAQDGIIDSFNPQPFHGCANENPLEWIAYFEQFTSYRMNEWFLNGTSAYKRLFSAINVKNDHIRLID
jgi:hypothetical protein